MRKQLLALVFVMTAGPLAAQEAMTESEKLAFWEQVSACYMPPEDTYNITVTVRFELDRDGQVVNDLVERIGAPAEANAQVRNLYEAARAAIVRCDRAGYDLPQEKYIYWQDIEMTFRAPVRGVGEGTE